MLTDWQKDKSPVLSIDLLLLLLLLLPFMQGIYIYIPETNRASRVYNVAAVQFMVSVMIFPVMNVLFCIIITIIIIINVISFLNYA
jgi:hypothetical protein